MPIGRGTSCFAVLILLTTSLPIVANPTISEIRKQQEELIKNTQQDTLKQRQVEDLAVEKGQSSEQIKNDVTFVLRGIKITGNNLLTKADVESLIQPLINTSVSSSRLKQLSQQLTQVLASKGYGTSRVFVPPQQIQNGNVEFRVEEDKLTTIHVVGEDSFKYEESLFYQYFSDLKGKVVHTPTLIERLKYLNFLPATKIKPTLRKVEFGKSALILVLEPQQDLTTVSLNNNASRFQGDGRVSYSTLVTNPTGRSDVFNFFAGINPEYPKYFSSLVGSYSVPIGDKGATLSLSHSLLDYQLDPDVVAGGELNGILQYEGDASTTLIKYEKPYFIELGANSWSVELERREASSRSITLLPDFQFADGLFGSLFIDQSEVLYSLNFATQHIFNDNLLGDNLPAQNVVKVKFAKALEGFMDGLTQEDINLKELNEDVPVLPKTGPVGFTKDATANFWKLYFNFLRRQVLPANINMNFVVNAEYSDFDNIPSSYDYGGADSGTSGLDWTLSFSRTFLMDSYLDWLNVELGYEQQNAFNVFIPEFAIDRSVQECGGKNDLIAGEYYRCQLNHPFVSLRGKSGSHILWLKYQSGIESYSLRENELTLTYSYVF